MFEVPSHWQVTRFCGTVTDGLCQVLVFETSLRPDAFLLVRMAGMTLEFSGVALLPRVRVRPAARRSLEKGWDHFSVLPSVAVRDRWT